MELDQRDIANDVLIHTFDKSETAEEFQGVTRTPDGADELAEHAEALQELDLRDVVRSPTRTQSIYKTALLFDSDIGDLADTDLPSAPAYVYDEWDGKASVQVTLVYGLRQPPSSSGITRCGSRCGHPAQAHALSATSACCWTRSVARGC